MKKQIKLFMLLAMLSIGVAHGETSEKVFLKEVKSWVNDKAARKFWLITEDYVRANLSKAFKNDNLTVVKFILNNKYLLKQNLIPEDYIETVLNAAFDGRCYFKVIKLIINSKFGQNKKKFISQYVDANKERVEENMKTKLDKASTDGHLKVIKFFCTNKNLKKFITKDVVNEATKLASWYGKEKIVAFLKQLKNKKGWM